MYLTNDDKYVIVWLLVAMPWYCIITSQTVVVVNGDSSMVDGRWAALRGDMIDDIFSRFANQKIIAGWEWSARAMLGPTDACIIMTSTCNILLSLLPQFYVRQEDRNLDVMEYNFEGSSVGLDYEILIFISSAVSTCSLSKIIWTKKLRVGRTRNMLNNANQTWTSSILARNGICR